MKTLLFICSIILFISCTNIVVNDLELKEYKYSDLSPELQLVFMENRMPYTDSSGFTFRGGSKNQFVNIDRKGRDVKFFYDAGKSGVKSTTRIITVDGINFEVVWNGNIYAAPYVFFNDAIYFLKGMGVKNKEEIMSATYVKADVSQYLK